MNKLVILVMAALLASCAANVPLDTAAERGYQALLDESWRLAEEELKTAIRDDGGDAYSMLNLGVVYASTGRAELAAQQYRGVLQYAGEDVAERATTSGREGIRLTELARENLAKLQ